MKFKKFRFETKALMDLLDSTKKDLDLSLTGNRIAARRARVNLLDIEKKGLTFRKESIPFIADSKEEKIIYYLPTPLDMIKKIVDDSGVVLHQGLSLVERLEDVALLAKNLNFKNYAIFKVFCSLNNYCYESGESKPIEILISSHGEIVYCEFICIKN